MYEYIYANKPSYKCFCSGYKVLCSAHFLTHVISEQLQSRATIQTNGYKVGLMEGRWYLNLRGYDKVVIRNKYVTIFNSY